MLYRISLPSHVQKYCIPSTSDAQIYRIPLTSQVQIYRIRTDIQVKICSISVTFNYTDTPYTINYTRSNMPYILNLTCSDMPYILILIRSDMLYILNLTRSDMPYILNLQSANNSGNHAPHVEEIRPSLYHPAASWTSYSGYNFTRIKKHKELRERIKNIPGHLRRHLVKVHSYSQVHKVKRRRKNPPKNAQWLLLNKVAA